MSKAVSLTIDGTNVLKGIAIVAVVLIHVLSSIQPSPFLADPLTSLIVVALDQVSRICVPLFRVWFVSTVHAKKTKLWSISNEKN